MTATTSAPVQHTAFLERVRIENFLSIADADLAFQPGLHLVTGWNHDMQTSNGSGKSSLADSLGWALYGVLYRDEARADAVVNRSARKDCAVTVRLRCGGSVVEVTRYRKHVEHGNGLEVVVDGQRRTRHTVKETQAVLDEVLPLSEHVFRHGVLVGQGMPHRFLALTDTQKQDLLCQIAGISVYDVALERTKQRLSETTGVRDTTAATAQERRVHLERLTGQRAALRQQIQEQDDRITAYRADVDQRRDAAQRRLEEVERQIEATRATAKGEAAKIGEEGRRRAEAIRADAAAVRIEIDKLMEGRDDLTQRLSAATSAQEEAQRALYQVESNVQAAEAELRSADAMLRMIGERYDRDVAALRGLSGSCPTCRQTVSPETVEHHVAELGRARADEEQPLRADVERLTQRVAMSRLGIDDVRAVVAQRTEAARDAAAALAQVDDRRGPLESRERALLHEAAEVVNAAVRRERDVIYQADVALARLEAEAEPLRRFAAQVDEALRALAAERDRLVAAAEANDGPIQTLQQELEDAVASECRAAKQARHWEFWKDVIPQLRASAIRGALAYLNDRVAAYMDTLSGGAIGVELYQEKHGKGSRVKVALRTDSGTYGLSSGGERRRVDLALYLALADMLHVSSGVRSNLLVCDEITDSLSPEGIAAFIEILRGKADEGVCVWVTTHNPNVRAAARFDSVIHVEKVAGRAEVQVVEGVG